MHDSLYGSIYINSSDCALSQGANLGVGGPGYAPTPFFFSVEKDSQFWAKN